MRLGVNVIAHYRALEGIGLVTIVDKHTMLAHPRYTEIVAHAADCEHQGVVGNHTARDELTTGLIKRGRKADFAARAVEAIHEPKAEFEMMLVRLGDIVDVVFVRVEGAGRDLVQQWFPQMREVGVHERYLRAAASSEFVAKARGEFDPAGATADNHDPMGVHAGILT